MIIFNYLLNNGSISLLLTHTGPLYVIIQQLQIIMTYCIANYNYS